MIDRLLGEADTRFAFRLVLLVTLICQLAFLLTIPLPRRDGQLVGSDGAIYYSFLPAVLVDRDLDFSDQYETLLSKTPRQLDRLMAETTRFGVPGNRLPFGTALFWSPFFVMAQSVASMLGWFGFPVDTSGCGFIAQAGTLLGSILYGGAALWLSFLFVRRYESSSSALVACLLLVLGGNLVYYMTAEPSMSHTVSAFVVSLLFFAWSRLGDRDQFWPFAVFGVIGGLAALVRLQDALLLAVPLLGSLWFGQTLVPRQEWRRTGRRLAYAVAGGLVALMVFSPQLLLWKYLYTAPEAAPYIKAAGRAGIDWLDPKLLKLFFSKGRGFFVWHPVFLFALTGLVLALRRYPKTALLCLGGFAVQAWVIACWAWSQGDSFGGRMLIACTPLFALGLARFIETVRVKFSWRPVMLAAGFLIVSNLLLFIKYRFDLVTSSGYPTWHDVTIGRVTFLLDVLGLI
jgi:hypothetical protein